MSAAFGRLSGGWIPALKKMLKDSEVTKALSEKAKALLVEMLPEGLNARREFEIDGKRYVAVLEKHTYYGADPKKPSRVHPGVTLYHGDPAGDNS